LNGARCRRKDITQLFLGTGLGSRSYAIIEQGMISRVIEARPEELRGFIEGSGRHLEVQRAAARDREPDLAHQGKPERLRDVREEVERSS
jgi:chromosome segregation protein